MLKYRTEILLCLITGVAVFALYFPVRNFSLIYFDDHAVLHYAEKYALEEGFNLRGIFAKGEMFPYRRPLVMLSLMLECLLFGGQYGMHHLVNLFFHIANVILLFWVFRVGTGYIWRSAVLAALFAVHPVNVEAVAWLSARVCLFSAFFFLLTVLFYIRYTARPSKLRYLPIVISFLLGLMAKPEIVYLPLVLILVDLWPLNRLKRRPLPNAVRPARKSRPIPIREAVAFLIRNKVPLLLIAMAYGVLTLSLYRSTPFYGRIDIARFIGYWLDHASLSYFLYLLIFFLPHRLNFFQSISSSDLSFFSSGGLALFLLLVTILVLRLSRTRLYLLTGWFWFLGTISISVCINVSQLDLISYRYAYIPGIGILLIMVWGGYDLITRIRYSRAFSVGLLVVLFPVIMVLSRQQVGCWKNMLTFYQCGNMFDPSASVFPERIYYNFANMLFQGGLIDDAEVYYRKALAFTPDNPYLYDKLGLLYATREEMKEAAAYYHKALNLRPRFALAHNNLANLLVETGEIDEAIVHYKAALQEAPVKCKIYNNMASALAQKGELEAAAACLQKALALNPQYETARENLQKLLLGKQEPGTTD